MEPEPKRAALFLASCVALVATSMSFAIRGDIMADFENVFLLSKQNVGWISGAAFWGFGLSIFIGGPLCDALGMGRILRLAAAGHIGGTLLTIIAPNFWVLFLATLLIGIANGLVEAACNPLIATIYPEQKTQKLTVFHAWFPGGIVIGGLSCVALNLAGFSSAEAPGGWKIKMALLLIPSVIYAAMIVGMRFPATERKAAGVSAGEMVKAALTKPLFLLVFVCMWLTAATELGPGQWITNIYNEVMQSTTGSGILLLVWGSGLMWALRQFGGGIAHRFSPVGLIAFTAPFAAAGLLLCNIASTPLMWFIASGLLYFGVCFWWPSMLGITSERFPRTGALGLAIIGGTGSISTAVAGPVMGWLNDTFGANRVLPIWSMLPVVLFVIFLSWYRVDRSRGGYRIEKISQSAE